MTSKDFQNACIEIIKDYTNKISNKKITNDDIFIVWYCKTLQNHKALLSTLLRDGMYYEITYNGDANEIYLDAYKKFENRCIKIEV